MLELREQLLLDRERDVVAHDVEQGEGAHRVAVVLGDRAVDGVELRPLLVRLDGVVEVREEQRVDDEAGAVGAAHGDLADATAEVLNGVEDVLAGARVVDDLDELHHRRRVEEVHADDVLRALGLRGEVGDAQRGGRRREDGARLADAVEVGEELVLDADLLRDGLDDDVDVAERLALGGPGESAEDRVGVALLEAALVDLAGEVLGDLGGDGVDLVLAARDVGDGEAVGGEDLDHAGRHGAGADDTDGLDRPGGALAGARGGELVGDDIVTFVGVEALARGLARASLGDEALDGGVGLVARVAGLLEAGGERVTHGLEAELVDDGERPLGQAAAEAHAVVDVLARGVLLVEHRGGVVQVREDQGVCKGAGV